MKTKIALTIPTGRPQIKEILRAFLDNAQRYGYDLNDFSIYLAIDTTYQNRNLEDFRLDSDLERRLKKVEYISEKERKKMSEKAIKEWEITPHIAQTLYQGNGYAKQRNAAITFALRDGNNVAICFDDDETPYVPLKKENREIQWAQSDFFTPHLEALLTGTDITKGPCLGYFSPIPSDFERDIPKDIRRKLGEALSLGNEVINKDSFLNIFMKQFKYLSESEFRTPIEPVIVPWGKHGKPVPGGNMGINLDSMRAQKIPIFYTPPNARGEDTIFGLQLKKAKVKKVNAYIFHDPFGLHPGILSKRFPKRPKPIPVTPDSKRRFANALIGWLKYAPLLIAMTSKNRKQRIREMIEKIQSPTQEIAKILDCPEINNSITILEQYGNNVDIHLQELAQTQREWIKGVIPNLSNPVLV